MKKIFLFLIILIFCLTNPTWSATYYVKNGGSDAFTGLSDAQAWETIAKVTAIVTSSVIFLSVQAQLYG